MARFGERSSLLTWSWQWLSWRLSTNAPRRETQVDVLIPPKVQTSNWPNGQTLYTPHWSHVLFTLLTDFHTFCRSNLIYKMQSELLLTSCGMLLSSCSSWCPSRRPSSTYPITWLWGINVLLLFFLLGVKLQIHSFIYYKAVMHFYTQCIHKSVG